ncbi:dienelactone hydrolase family protein [Afifella pfennigii]|uniref:dienelactone hydrolase family protein n=1 Tax=Afifella pfennigii TaxID=209897 RepID=UPI00047A85D0|nr:dienelactone hydrolase family protein [Afifella pfennigii]
MPKLILFGALLLGVAVLAVSLNAARQAARLTIFDEAPEARAERLSEHWRLLMPDGPGPHPAAIVLSGCDGVRDNMDYWAAEFVRTGRAALILDSHSARGLNRLEAWRLVCAGQALTGSERAGDVAVALQAMKQMEDVSEDVVIFGASHGGWTAMEFVAHAVSGERPTGLALWPAPPDELLRTVSALVLLYPYCGRLNGAEPESWNGAPPTLMILAEKDSIVDTQACLSRAAALGQTTATVETAVIAGADHGFDQRDKSVLSSLVFDADKRDSALGTMREFLARLGLL